MNKNKEVTIDHSSSTAQRKKIDYSLDIKEFEWTENQKKLIEIK